MGKYFDGKLIFSGAMALVVVAAGAYVVKNYLPSNVPLAGVVKDVAASAAS